MLHKILLRLLLLTVLFNISNVQAKQLTAKSWLVSDSAGQIIASENIDEVRAIASISKLIAVITVLDAKQDLTQLLPLSTKIPDRLPRKSMSLTRRQLIELAMINSDNRAAQTLCEQFTGGFDACVLAMNAKVRGLGMTHTVVYEPTGLDNRNQSTARELVQLVLAGRQYDLVLDAAKQTRVEIKIKKKYLIFPQTNSLVGKTQRVIVSKTGYTSASGGCLAMLIATDLGERVVIVMGSRNTHTRIPEAEFISNMPEDDKN